MVYMKQILGVIGIVMGFTGMYVLFKLDNFTLGQLMVLTGSGLIGFSLSKKK